MVITALKMKRSALLYVLIKSCYHMDVINIPEFKVPESIPEALHIQKLLRSNLVLSNNFKCLEMIAGVDVGYDVEHNLAHASIVVVTAKNFIVLETVQNFTPVTFPYVPGLLSFREIPAILSALTRLTHRPDLLMIDGQGIAHPRRMGIAAHLGVLLDIPSIGVAKSRLAGHFKMPGSQKGEVSDLIDRHELVGKVLRSRNNVRPLFISPGHRIDINTALTITMECLTRYRLPEPTRLADKFSKVKKTALPLV